MTIKALVFDLDDTLWPIVPLIIAAEEELHDWMAVHAPKVVDTYSIADLRAQRIALVATDLRFSYDLWALRHTALQNVFTSLGIAPDLADVAMQIFAQARNRVSFFPDVLPALTRLQSNFTMGSISNGFADLNAIGLGHYFQISIAAHSFGCAKPDPSIFLEVVKHLKLSPNEIMYVGDDLRLDVEAAQSVGMRAAWVNRKSLDLQASAHSHIKPDLIVANLHDLVLQLGK
jgi:2-haloalkanoic acid dehalogenase type II